MEKFASKKGVSVYAYKGDAMTLLAFDLKKTLTKNFVGFTIHVTADDRSFYLYNRLSFKKDIKLHRKPADIDELLSSEFSPIQKFRWVHVPSTVHYINNPYFGDYTYEVTPRYIENGVLLKPDSKLTVRVTIEVSPFTDGDVLLGFTRGFVSSQAYAYHFGNNTKLRPNKTDLIFDIKQKSGTIERMDKKTKSKKKVSYTYEEQHEYLGWQARDRVMEFIDEVIENKNLRLDVFAYDLNEPVIVQKLMNLAKQGRLRIILDNYPNHIEPDCPEMKFEELFKNEAKDASHMYRGHFLSQAHSKIFIQRTKNNAAKAKKILTGSTNFTTNGIYINANHTIVFNNAEVAQLYADVFDASFGKTPMGAFKKSKFAKTEYTFSGNGLPNMTIHFSPHPKDFTDELFDKIADKVNNASSDVLFAIMIDDSKGSILDAIQKQVKSDNIFTYGITDKNNDISLYKPNSKTGIKVTGLGTATLLPPPFNEVAKIPGHNIHHKFIVVDFKGENPVVYCGSSNLAYNPEQQNGDNLLEIHDKDLVTAFAIEAFRLVDHFHWRNREMTSELMKEGLYLKDGSEAKEWWSPYYNPNDLRYMERELLVK
jgi:phosphatidylserine/phosphatidylglycerophosphate/cardiolipin synthase-like enzyme